jgi:hypothetical protein
MRLTTKLIALIIILLSVAAPVFAATNLLENADFETSMIANLIPGWVVFTGRIGVDITDTEQRTGLRSSPILAVPNGVYEAGVYVYDATSTRVFLYLDFWNSNQQRIAHKTIATTAKNQWEELRVRLTAPEDALFVSIILYNTSGNLGSAYFDHAWLYLVDE